MSRWTTPCRCRQSTADSSCSRSDVTCAKAEENDWRGIRYVGGVYLHDAASGCEDDERLTGLDAAPPEVVLPSEYMVFSLHVFVQTTIILQRAIVNASN